MDLLSASAVDRQNLICCDDRRLCPSPPANVSRCARPSEFKGQQCNSYSVALLLVTRTKRTVSKCLPYYRVYRALTPTGLHVVRKIRRNTETRRSHSSPLIVFKTITPYCIAWKKENETRSYYSKHKRKGV